jgi:outer membrane protein
LLTHPNRVAIVVGQLPTQLAATGPLTGGLLTDSEPLVAREQHNQSEQPEAAPVLSAADAPPVSGVSPQTLGENTAPELDPNFSTGLGEGAVIPLPAAYHLAIQNEERIKIAGHELGKAQLLPWRAIAQLTPRSDIRGLYTRNKDEISFDGGGAANPFGGASTIRPLARWTGIFSITQPILEPAFFASRKLGKASVQESQERYDFTIREILFGVARAYYSVLRSQAQVTVARDTLALSQDELRQAQVRFRVGEVTKTDVLRAEVTVERGERTVVTDHNRLRLAYTTLARTIGMPEPLGVMEPKPAVYNPVPYSQLLEQAYAQRQDFRAQEIGVDIVKQQKNLVLARYFPRVNARWEFPRLDTETFAERDKFWTLFLNFEIPLFDGGTRELDLLEQNENLAQSKLRVDQMRKDIQVEVKDALVTVETLGSTLNTLEKEVDLAQENYDITSKQYRVGLATSLDLNTSLNALNQVRTQLIDQRYAYQVALLRLQQTTGVFAQDYVS